MSPESIPLTPPTTRSPSPKNASNLPLSTPPSHHPYGISTFFSLNRLDTLSTVITAFWTEISALYTYAKTCAFNSSRTAAVQRLNDLVATFKIHIEEHRRAMREADKSGIVRLYVVAGMTEEEAKREADEDFERVEKAMGGLEGAVKEMMEGFVCGEEDKKEEKSMVDEVMEIVEERVCEKRSEKKELSELELAYLRTPAGC